MDWNTTQLTVQAAIISPLSIFILYSIWKYRARLQVIRLGTVLTARKIGYRYHHCLQPIYEFEVNGLLLRALSFDFFSSKERVSSLEEYPVYHKIHYYDRKPFRVSVIGERFDQKFIPSIVVPACFILLTMIFPYVVGS